MTYHIVGDPEFIGSFPVRQDIEILPADPITKITFQDKIVITSRGITRRKQNGLNLGWTVKEVIGIGIVNPRGLSKGRKSVVIG